MKPPSNNNSIMFIYFSPQTEYITMHRWWTVEWFDATFSGAFFFLFIEILYKKKKVKNRKRKRRKKWGRKVERNEYAKKKKRKKERWLKSLTRVPPYKNSKLGMNDIERERNKRDGGKENEARIGFSFLGSEIDFPAFAVEKRRQQIARCSLLADCCRGATTTACVLLFSCWLSSRRNDIC